jgi:lambda family phage portal protein
MNFLDRIANAVSPAWYESRMESRAKGDRAAAYSQTLQNYGYSHGGASRSKTSVKGWDAASASPQKDIDANLKTLRERSRDLYYNSPVATSAINRNLVHIVGSGLRASPKIAWRRLGITKERADEIAADVKFKFGEWARSKDCDVTGQNNFYELQQIAILTWLIGGEVFGLPAYSDNRLIDLCLRLVEGDLCCNPGGLSGTAGVDQKCAESGNRIRNGIEIDDQGRVVAYHFVKGYRDQVEQREWVRVPARGNATGNPNVLHVFNAIRPTQYRGVPYLAPVIECIKQLTRYTDAEIMAAVINGLFSVFITSEEGGVPDFAEPLEGYQDIDGPESDDELALGNGNIGFLKPGEAVQIVDAKRPNTNFDGFTSAMAKHIGAALNIPAELLLMQFTASYSASRGALLEAWNFFSLNREWFAADFCQPIYEMWLSEAVSKGLVDMPGFFADEYTRAAWCGCNWTGPAPGQLNPTVEVNAAVAKMNAGLSTGEREALAMNGSDYAENIEQLATERALRIEQGMEKEDDTNQG